MEDEKKKTRGRPKKYNTERERLDAVKAMVMKNYREKKAEEGKIVEDGKKGRKAKYMTLDEAREGARQRALKSIEKKKIVDENKNNANNI